MNNDWQTSLSTILSQTQDNLTYRRPIFSSPLLIDTERKIMNRNVSRNAKEDETDNNSIHVLHPLGQNDTSYQVKILACNISLQ
jgi:hypothetical protein